MKKTPPCNGMQGDPDRHPHGRVHGQRLARLELTRTSNVELHPPH